MRRILQVVRMSGLLVLLAVVAMPRWAGAASKAVNPDNTLADLGNGIIEEVGVAGRMWQQERSGPFRSMEEAQAYVQTMNLGGHKDWRLPTIQELYDLHYLVDVKKAKGIELRMEGNYWVTDPEGHGMAGSWEIGDQCEPSRSYFKKNFGYVRAVRP